MKIIRFIINSNYGNQIKYDSVSYLATFALGAQKILPLIQTIYRMISNIRSKKYEVIEQYDFKEIIKKYNLRDSIVALIFKDDQKVKEFEEKCGYFVNKETIKRNLIICMIGCFFGSTMLIWPDKKNNDSEKSA